MKVIGAGFGRTGTTSLKAALQELGFGPSYSLTEVFENPQHVGFWEAARRGERVDWRGFFEGYEVAVDWPACAFYEELMEAFPEAPVVLTVRDPEPWYESMRATIYQLRKLTNGPFPLRAAFALAGMFAPGPAGVARLADRLVWEDAFDGRFEDRAYAVQVFEASNEEVRRRVPRERLLVFDVRDGWGPLCAFLGLKIPDKPFPHLNEAKEMRRRLLGLVTVSAVALTLAMVTVFATVAFLIRLRKKPDVRDCHSHGAVGLPARQLKSVFPM